MTTAADAEVVLRCEDISVAYGDFLALQPTSLSFAKGKIHVLVGQNGAGKTSFARVLAGIVPPHTGQFWIHGRALPAANVRSVRAAGLDIVHQRFTLPPNFSVAEALELVAAKKFAGAFFSLKRLTAAWAGELRSAELEVSPAARIRDLPIETVQSLEIARALAGQADFLILDEPTALLSPVGIERLFTRLRKLRASGVTLLLILHKLREVMEIADTISVLRAGNLVLPPTAAAAVSRAELSQLIIGEAGADELSLPAETFQRQTSAQSLALKAVRTRHSQTEPALANISLALDVGEILGIAGVEGNGQRRLVDVITGLGALQGGEVLLLNRDVRALTHHQRRALGLRVVPFDRVAEGASLGLSLWENVTIWQAQAFKRGRLPWLSISAMRAAARRALDQFDVQYDSLDQPAGALSGGNMQRMILARELAGQPRLLIAAQPTRGLDFRATHYVWSLLRQLKSAGGSVLVISSDLDELMTLCDRILVMRGGELVGEHRPPFQRQAIGGEMIGAQA